MTIFLMYFYYSTQRFVIEFRRLETTFYFHFLKSASMFNTYGCELVVPELQVSQKSTLSVLSINDIECLPASPLYSRQYTSVQKDGSEFTSDLKHFKTGISYLWCKVLQELSHAAQISHFPPLLTSFISDYLPIHGHFSLKTELSFLLNCKRLSVHFIVFSNLSFFP